MYDRMIFKGRLTALYKDNGAKCFLWTQGVALKDFTPYAKWTTAQIADNARGLATAAGRPVISFDHVKTRNYSQRKDELVLSIAAGDGISEGVICVISAVESCMSFQVRKSFTTKTTSMYRQERKCLHHYVYLMDPEFGFMHIRVQGWIPYDVQAYINGREWLARRLDEAGVGYVRCDNSLLKVDDLEVASRLCEGSPTGPGPGFSTPSPASSTPSPRRGAPLAMAATTGSSTRPRSPPTSCSTLTVTCSRSGPTWFTTPP